MSTPVALATMVAILPRTQWPNQRCVAWIESSQRHCGKYAEHHLCSRHQAVAERRWGKHVADETARRVKAAQKRAQQLPGWIAERDRTHARIQQLDPDLTKDTAAYAGDVHQTIRSARKRHLADWRVQELARAVERLRHLDQQIGDAS